MKKTALLLLCTILSTMSFAQFSGSGTGTSNDPYLIFNENQLSQMSNFLNQEGVYFKLMKDLDMTSWIAENNPSQGWLPIGIASSPFKGVFLGNNHALKGMKINRSTTDNVGFFGYTDGAEISNLILEGTEINGQSIVGALVACANNTTISGCKVSMTIVGHGSVGGLVGTACSVSVSDCAVTEGIIDAGEFVGGLVGSVDGPGAFSITNSQANCDVKCFNGGGGLVGLLFGTSATFTSCLHIGEISSKGGDYHGGLIGEVRGGCLQSMTDCSHFGNITGKNYAGGLIGAIENTEEPGVYYISSSINTNDKRHGPFTHVTDGTTKSAFVNNCTAIGNISGGNNVGGLIGSDEVAATYTFSRSGEIKETVNQYVSSYKQSSSYYQYRYYSHFLLYRNEIFTEYSEYKEEDHKNFDGEVPFSATLTFTDIKDIVQTSLTNSYYSGNIQGTDNVGGLVGYKEGGSLTKCYSYATMVQGATNVGGLVGKMQGTVPVSSAAAQYLTLQSNFAINSTVNATKSDLGRVYGLQGNEYVTIGALGSAVGNIALTRTKVILSGVVQEVTDCIQHGKSMGPSLLKLKASYVAQGWDFDNDWTQLETECFPYKRYQAAPPVISSDLVSQATTISGQSVNGGTVYLYYKDHDPVSCQTADNQWTFSTEPLQSGAGIQLCAHVDGMTPSYFTITSVSYPGSGTKDDPYRVYTAADLQGVSGTGYYKMMNDIDLTSWISENSPTKGWISVGRNSGEATYFDGDGHTISGLWTNTTDEYTGLFSNFSTGEITNLTVQIKEGLKVKGGDYTGGLIGRNANGKIENVTVKGNVEGTHHVGGVVGIITNNKLQNVSYEGTVQTASAGAMVGGVVAQSTSSTDQFSQCEATATLSATATGADAFVGGLAGKSAGKLTKCHAQVNLTAAGTTSQVGGLVGQSDGAIDQCYTTGTVKATGNESNTGGLVGKATAAITNSYSTANVTGTQYTAGLVGYTTSSINKCYAKGNVYGVNYGAGLVGELDGANAQVQNSIAANNTLSLSAQSSWGSRVIGGYKNGAPDPQENNYALNTMQVSLNNVPQTKTDDLVEGIAKTQAELQTAATYSTRGWDFTNTWGIDSNIYPFLLWEVTVSKVETITLDPTTLLIAVGNTGTIAATVAPLSATNRTLEWSSSNESVATVSGGVVTAKAIGTAVITAAATDGSGVKATCQVTVCKNEGDAITVLRSLVENAQTLYDNSVEGTNIGEYATGARQQLLTVINSVKAQISDTMDAAAITSCTNTINAAIETFQSKKVTSVADTNIASYDNILYAPTLEVTPGQQALLSICMKNAVDLSSFEFNLVLPEGVSIAWSEEDDDYAINQNTSRASLKRFTTTFAEQPDGSMHVICYSSQNYAFVGNEGEVLNILLDVDAEMADGDYALCINNQQMATASMVKYDVAQCKSTLRVLAYVLGDVNGDHQVSVVDINGVVNLILGTNTSGLVTKAADTNCDGDISVVDINGVVNIILYGNPMGPSAALARRGMMGEPTAIQMEDVTLTGAQTTLVGLNVDGVAGIYSSMQFDVMLPEGVTLDAESDKYHLVSTSLQADGRTRVVCTSLSNHPFSSSTPLILSLTADCAEEGDYSLTLTNIELARPDLSTAHPADFAASLRIQGTTGIGNLQETEGEAVYNLKGIRMEGASGKTEQGVYIRNKQKTINR